MKAVVVALAFLSGGPGSAFQLGSPKLLAGRGVALARLKSRSSRGGGDEGEGDSSRMADRVRQAARPSRTRPPAPRCFGPTRLRCFRCFALRTRLRNGSRA